MWITTGPRTPPPPERHQFWNLELPELDGVRVCLCKIDNPDSAYDFKRFTLSIHLHSHYPSFYETIVYLETLDRFIDKELPIFSLELDGKIREAEYELAALKKLKKAKELLVYSLGDLKEILRAEGMTE